MVCGQQVNLPFMPESWLRKWPPAAKKMKTAKTSRAFAVFYRGRATGEASKDWPYLEAIDSKKMWDLRVSRSCQWVKILSHRINQKIVEIKSSSCSSVALQTSRFTSTRICRSCRPQEFVESFQPSEPTAVAVPHVVKLRHQHRQEQTLVVSRVSHLCVTWPPLEGVGSIRISGQRKPQFFNWGMSGWFTAWPLKY